MGVLVESTPFRQGNSVSGIYPGTPSRHPDFKPASSQCPLLYAPGYSPNLVSTVIFLPYCARRLALSACRTDNQEGTKHSPLAIMYSAGIRQRTRYRPMASAVAPSTGNVPLTPFRAIKGFIFSILHREMDVVKMEKYQRMK